MPRGTPVPAASRRGRTSEGRAHCRAICFRWALAASMRIDASARIGPLLVGGRLRKAVGMSVLHYSSRCARQSPRLGLARGQVRFDSRFSRLAAPWAHLTGSDVYAGSRRCVRPARLLGRRCGDLAGVVRARPAGSPPPAGGNMSAPFNLMLPSDSVVGPSRGQNFGFAVAQGAKREQIILG